jgi:hypothetical protein
MMLLIYGDENTARLTGIRHGFLGPQRLSLHYLVIMYALRRSMPAAWLSGPSEGISVPAVQCSLRLS